MMRHVLRAEQFDRSSLDYIYQLTNRIRQFDKSKEGLLYLQGLLREKRAMLYFTQTSTRTFLSFQSACHILGIQPLDIRDPSISSEYKGESIEDSLRTFSSYVDLIIMRSAMPGLCDRTAQHLDQTPRSVPIINAGSGQDEHPTQAVLDIYTMMRSFKGVSSIDGKTICFVGDIKRGRTIHSLVQMLCQFDRVKMIFVSPPEFGMSDDLQTKLRDHNIQFSETDDFEGAIEQTDVIYMTRIQDEYDERLSDHGVAGSSEQRDFAKTCSLAPFCLRQEHLKKLKDRCIIMHPFPRRSELDRAIDDDRRAMYWRQERNGMWVRVTLIAMILGVDSKIVPLQL